MVTCPKCNERVNNALLRSDSPKCQNEHELGRWSVCKNQGEKHVYLSLKDAACPYCDSPAESSVKEGVRVKCLHATTEGAICTTGAFLWMKEGPPCFMNHIGKMKLEI